MNINRLLSINYVVQPRVGQIRYPFLCINYVVQPWVGQNRYPLLCLKFQSYDATIPESYYAQQIFHCQQYLFEPNKILMK